MKTFTQVFVIGLTVLLMFFMAAVPFAVAKTSGGDFTWRTQTIIGVLRWIEPLLRVTTILVLYLAAFRQPEPRRRRWLIGTVALTIIGVLSALTNYRANALILAWDANAPPSGWEVTRDAWLRWHLARIANTILTLVVVIIVNKKAETAVILNVRQNHDDPTHSR